MFRLSRPARGLHRRVVYSSVEVAPVLIADGVATIECRTPILARVAERYGFRRVEAAVDIVPPDDSASASVLPSNPNPVSPIPERERVVEEVLEGSVDLLHEALDAGRLDDLLAIAYVGELSGKNRVTAKRAILARSRRIGVSFDVP